MENNKLYSELSPRERYLIKVKEYYGETMWYHFMKFLLKKKEDKNKV